MTRTDAATRIMGEQRIVGRYRKARHPRTIDGSHIIGATYNNQAIALWHHDGPVDRETLVSMFHEAKALGLEKPLHVYGRCCLIYAPDSFIFHQIDY